MYFHPHDLSLLFWQSKKVVRFKVNDVEAATANDGDTGTTYDEQLFSLGRVGRVVVTCSSFGT